MKFAEVVATSGKMAATRARSVKITALADLMCRLEHEELRVAVAILTGEPRQGRIGIGWRTVAKVDVAPSAEPLLEILDVDSALTTLAGLSGPGSQARRSEVMDDLFGRATADEQRFIGQLLVGELRQGALAGVVTDGVAESAGVLQAAVRRAAMLAGDLPEVAVIAHRDGEAGLADVRMRLLHPVQPMLAQTAESVDEALAQVGGPASVEWKLDGARVQVHKDGTEVRIFTRSLNDVTAQLPELVSLVRELPAQQLVLDGEAVGWGEDERPEMFQDVMSRFSREHLAREVAAGADPDQGPSGDGGSDDHGRAEAGGADDDGAAGGPGLQARFFDLVHLDGMDLFDLPLTDRLDLLDRVVGRWRMPGVLTDDPEEAAAVLDEALAKGHEGVMVKAASSSYEAGRRGGAWRKVKPVHTLDLVVLAVEHGSGRRRGWLSNLHLGARATGDGPVDVTGPDGTGFVMVGKTFKGLTDELLTWQTEQFRRLATDDDDHVVTVRPELVVEIALDGIQRSTRYQGGVALRFARVRHYRPDKPPDQADTIDTVRALLG